MSGQSNVVGGEPPPATVRLSAAVYAQRHGKILILKRAMGEVTGGWSIPGGAVDQGETLEEAALRELREEAGLTPSSPLALIGLVPMRVYGSDTIQVTYACDCPTGEVSISVEHSGARWIDPREYRERYFSDDVIDRLAARDRRVAGIIEAVRDNLDTYLAWREHRLLDRQLRGMRLTVEVFVVRDAKILVLKRQGGLGDGFWYLPGGVVEPSEEPLDAAVRETQEETGLPIESPQLLRVWSWRAQNDVDAYHATYVAESPHGDVRLSEEHSAHRWMEPREYSERYCNEGLEAAVPAYASFFRQVRLNMELVASRLASSEGET